LARSAKAAGAKVVYAVFLLYYAYRKKEVPKWAKVSILGSIAYFLSPIDLIPDLTPLLGYSDDLGVLIASLIAVSVYIDNEVKTKAKERMKKWFSDSEIESSSTWVDRDIKSKMS
jgi:uncharacterized membrane protein YkvA (DUF1232 family)